MNMISTGAFLNEMDASNKQLTVAEQFAAVWEKKNAKAARAGGVSLMALSLAACGGSSSTSTTSTDTSSDTTTTAANQSFVATTGIDNMVGGDGDDTFFTIATGTTASAQPGDTFTGGAGADLLAITATGTAAATVAGLSLSGIETIRVSDTNTGGTDINLAGVTGVTKLMAFGSANTGDVTTFLNVGAVADLELSNTSSTGGVTLNYTSAASTGATTQNIIADTAVATGNITIAGVETVNVTASGESTVNMILADAETVNITANDDTTIGLVSATNDEITAVSGGTSAGDITLTVDFDLTEMTVTGGAGDDVFDTTSGTLGTNDTLDGGDGTDTLLYQDDAAGAIASATIAGTAATITNVEQIELQADTTGGMTVDMDAFDGIDTIILDDNAGVTFTLNDLSAADAAGIQVQVSAGNNSDVELDMKDGSGTTDAASISATMGSGAGSLTIGDANGNIETLTVTATGDANQTITLDNGDFAGSTSADGSVTFAGGKAGRDMTITQTTSNIVAETVNFSGVASDVTITLGAADQTVTGGTGDDTIDFGANFTRNDSVDGGDGTDVVVLAPSASIARPGTITNVEKIELAASATSTIAATSFTGVTEIVLSNAAGLDGQTVTLNGLTGVTKITHDVADAAAADGADDANGVTITSGYTGTADALELAIDNAGTNAGATVMGAVTVNGVENMTVSVTGGTDNDSATVGGITSNTLDTLTVTSSGFVATASTASRIVLGTVSDGTNDSMSSFSASGANAGVSVTLADMGAASTITGSDYLDTIILTGSTGDDLVIDTGNGNDQITLASGVDRVTLTTGTGDTDIFFAGGDGHTVTLGTGANVLDFDGAGAPAETTGVTVNGFTSDDDIRADAGADTAVNIYSAQTTALSSALIANDTTVFTLNAGTADALIDGNDAATAVADFTDVADAGDVEVLLELLFGGNGAGGTGMVVLNDGTDSYVYAATVSSAEEVTALSLVATIDAYVVNGATDIVL